MTTIFVRATSAWVQPVMVIPPYGRISRPRTAIGLPEEVVRSLEERAMVVRVDSAQPSPSPVPAAPARAAKVPAAASGESKPIANSPWQEQFVAFLQAAIAQKPDPTDYVSDVVHGIGPKTAQELIDICRDKSDATWNDLKPVLSAKQIQSISKLQLGETHE